MPRVLRFLCAAALVLPALAEDNPPPPPPAGDAPPAADGGPGRGRDRDMRRFADDPELKGVDLSTPEGQDKLRQVMQARMEKHAPQMRQRMAEHQAAQHAELKKAFGLSDEEFAAVEPLLTRVESLRQQKGIVDRSGGPGGPGGFSRRGPRPDPKLFLGDTPMEPTVQEVADALKALKALIDDKQANANEMASAIARVRKAREAFQVVLAKAQDELRSVLTPRQEAELVDRGTLE